jgi:hypothetical protein
MSHKDSHPQPTNDPFQVKSFEELMHLAREKSLYAKTGDVIVVPGQLVGSILSAGTTDDVKARINELIALVKRGPSLDWRNPAAAKEAQTEAADAAMLDALDIAEASQNADELHYLAGMFIHHRVVMRAVAANPAISPVTQLLLANDPVLSKDRGIQLALAHNQALTADTMKHMYNRSDDPFVLTGLAMNAVAQSKRSRAACEFGNICLAAAKSLDGALRVVALAGVKDSEFLEKAAFNTNPFFAPKELESIAGNSNTPVNALQHIARTPLAGLQKAFGFQAADRARATLANIRYEKGLSSENTAPAY